MGQKSLFHVDITSFHQKVTGSCTQVCIQYPDGYSTRFLVDCGLFQERNDALNEDFKFDASKIDFVLVTHNHVDHTGRLPLLKHCGYKGNIYASTLTCELMIPALTDTQKILKVKSKIQNQKPLYNEDDTSKTIDSFEFCEFGETICFNDNIKFTFFKNGHLLGASLILVQISYPNYEDINLLFTGDYNNKNIFFDVPKLPEWILELPITIITESTYGNTFSKDIIPCFDNNILEALPNATVICPVFSQGRSQEILERLKSLQTQNLLDKNIPIYLDGKLAIKYTDRYKRYCSYNKMPSFIPENFRYVDGNIRDELIQDSSPKIILTSSGMGTYGPAQIYLSEFITRKNALIHFTGYCSPDSLGRKLIDAHENSAVTIGGRVLKKFAQVTTTNEFSAHAKADELAEFINQFSNVKLVLVNHGEPEVKESFAEFVLNNCKSKNVGILGDCYAFRVNRYGFVKSFPT